MALLGVFVGPIMELVKCILPPIKRQLNYLCCFKRNKESLTEESHGLTIAKVGLEMKVGVAKDKAEVILPQVENWLERASHNQSEVDRLEDEISTMQRGNWIMNLRSHYLLSKKVKKATEAIKLLRDECNFDPISQPAPPAAVSKYYNDDDLIIDFESRKQIEDDIIYALMDESVCLIGIWGMGGVGKTTMANTIMQRVKRENLFDEVIKAVISQPLDLLKIQVQLMEQLGLDIKRYETVQAKAHQLRTRLTNTKRILVVLDDLWQKLELGNVGISFGSSSTNCKVILTTRDGHLLKLMDAKSYEMKSMSQPEAWDFFKNIVGISFNDDLELHHLAEEVSKECKGLPLALVTIGGALKNEKDARPWKDALRQLRSSYPKDMPKVLEGVYKPLKLSYDRLDTTNTKSLFRLCGVFPEDHDISIEDLTTYSLGLNKIEGIFSTVEEVRDRVFTLVGTLKSCSLLLQGKDKNHIKMHDAVRDVAIFISKTEASPEMEYIAWVSGISNETFSSTLRFLAMQNLQEDELPENQWNNLFERTRDLNVLRLESIFASSLPQTVHLLKNLHMLHLIGCMNLKSIVIVGELTHLGILSIKYCNSVLELPSEIGRLKQLRLLEVYSCKSLGIVERGVLSSLSLLEELKMRESFKGWEAEEDRRNVSLKELESLSKLSCLEIEIEDANLAAIEISLPPRVTKFYIEIGKGLFSYRHDSGNVVSLDFPVHIVLGNWIHKLVERSEIIELAGDAASNILEYFSRSTYLKRLGIHKCSTIKALVNHSTSSNTIRGGSFFPFLECLTLVDLCNLEKIWDGSIPMGSNFLRNLKSLRLDTLPRMLQLWSINPNPNLSLANLSTLEIKRCYNLQNIFQLSLASLQLESIGIDNCNSMKEIFSIEMLSDDGRRKSQLTFPKLKNMKIAYLSNFTIFCKGAESIEFPRLVRMEIGNFAKLNSHVPIQTPTNSRLHDQDLFQFLYDCKVAFGSLRELIVFGVNENIGSLWYRQIPSVPCDLFQKLETLNLRRCYGIKDLFASPIVATNLVNLKWFFISVVPEMVTVIGEAMEEELANVNSNVVVAKTSSYSQKLASPHQNNNCCLFPNLIGLFLFSLPKLERFIGGWKCCSDGDTGNAVETIELPSLRTLHIYQCGRMERFTLPGMHFSTPNLKYFKIDENDMIPTKDVNDAIEQCNNYLRSTAESSSREIDEEIEETLKVDSILVSTDCDFVVANNGVKVPVSYLVGKSALLYFAGQWKNAWCRDFLSKLIDAYHEINAKSTSEEEALEVIFVSEEQDEASYEEFFLRMPMQWLAIPFGDNRISSLYSLCKVRNCPMVVAITPTGETLTTNVAHLISRYGVRAYPFTKERMKEIEEEDDKTVEGWPLELKIDQLHPHMLLLIKLRSAHICDGCGEAGGVWFYRCDECDFDLHNVCALITEDDNPLRT